MAIPSGYTLITAANTPAVAQAITAAVDAVGGNHSTDVLDSPSNGGFIVTNAVAAAYVAPVDPNAAVERRSPNVGRTTALFNNGVFQVGQGDFAPSVTLTASITISFQGNVAGPQRKLLVIKQAASGGPYTVTWPKPGSPTLAAPAVYWAGGTAPTMTVTASATDVYELITVDGIKWYGVARQAVA